MRASLVSLKKWMGAALALAAALAVLLALALDAAETKGPNSPATLATESPTGVEDLDGHAINPFQNTNAKAAVLIFIDIECPISNRYAPEIQRLHAKFSPRGIDFWLAQPDREASVEKTRGYLSDFGYSMGLVRDLKHALVNRAGAKVTPEAAVFLPGQRLAYRGRIDNRYADYNKMRPEPTERNLHDALEAILSGKPVAVTNTTAIGCYISK